MCIRRTVNLSTGLAALAVATLSSAAFAQSEAPASPPQAAPIQPDSQQPASQQSSSGLEDIVVTAQKRAQNVQDVPIAISALTGTQLTAAGVLTTADLKTSFAGVNIRTTGSNLYPYIRGIGTATNNVENPVAFYIDGVYYASQSDARRDLNDIDQIAVLKGPQGTLFGRNATGGVIQVTTRRPSHTFSGELTTSIDNYAQLRTGVYVTGPVSDTIAFSLSGNFVKQFEGWGKNYTTGRDTYAIDHAASVRGKLLIQPDDRTDITVIGDFTDRSDNAGAYYRALPGTQFSPLVPYREPPGTYDSYANNDSLGLFRGGGLSVNIERELGFANFQSVSSFRRFQSGYATDVDATPATGYFLDTSHTQGTSFSQELQLTSGESSKIKWAVGAFYFYYRNALEPVHRVYGGPLFAPAGTSYVDRNIRSSEVTNSVAPFGQLDIEVLPKTHVTLGARWTYERRELNGTDSGTRANGTVVPVILSVQGATLTAKKPTWRIALDHQFTDDILGYVSWNRGFKSGGFNISNLANPSYQPESLDAYETGLKTELFGRKIRLNSALFYYKYENVQVNQLIGGLNTIGNGAKAELYGLDVDFETRLAKGLRLSGGFEILHSEFTDYRNAAVSTPNPAGGVIVATGNATGNRLPAAQKFNGNISLDYEVDVSFGKLAANATWNHNGNYFLEVDNVASQKAYDMVNFNTSWTSLNKAWTLGLFVRNVLDKKIISYAAAFSGLGYVTAYDNPPRTYGATAKLSF